MINKYVRLSQILKLLLLYSEEKHNSDVPNYFEFTGFYKGLRKKSLNINYATKY